VKWRLGRHQTTKILVGRSSSEWVLFQSFVNPKTLVVKHLLVSSSSLALFSAATRLSFGFLLWA
jgi:hypothetical protein